MICDLGGFDRGSVAGESESKQRDRGVACAGNIKDLAGLGRDMMGRLFAWNNIIPCSPRVIRRYFAFPFREQNFADSN